MAAEGTFRHWACVYDSDQQFLETAVPFLADGLAAGHRSGWPRCTATGETTPRAEAAAAA
jgi:hypothetical protein